MENDVNGRTRSLRLSSAAYVGNENARKLSPDTERPNEDGSNPHSGGMPASVTLKLAELVSDLDRCTRDLGSGVWPTAIPQLFIGRFETPRVPERKMNEALTCLIVQGVENLFVGETPMSCPAGASVIVAQRVPLIREVVPIDASRPYLCATVKLDIAVVNALIQDLELSTESSTLERSVVSAPADQKLIATFARLISLASDPLEARVLGPQALRELYFRLLTGPNGVYVRDLTVGSRKFLRVTEGMEWLRAHLDRQISMEQLARHMGMSLSAMHQAFRMICGMTPLEFHKQLRLQRARTILLSEPADIASVATRTGYNSTSQFIREYRRMFGTPPGSDARQHGRSTGSSLKHEKKKCE